LSNENANEAGVDAPASSIPAEEWREIEDTDYMYEVSNMGRVRSWKRPGGGGLRRTPVILNPTSGNHGYLQVVVRQNGKRRNRTLQTLVVDAFAQSDRRGMVVRHLNGDKHDNRLSNLAVGTYIENGEDGIGLGEYCRGEKQPHSRLTADRVHELRFGSRTVRDLAEEWAMHRGTLDQAKRGDTWRHLPMPEKE